MAQPLAAPQQPNMADLIRGVTTEIKALGLAEQVRKFNGEGQKRFKDWLKDITRVTTAVNADAARVRTLCLQTVTGPAADYLTRYISNNQQATWAQIRQSMAAVYADEADADIALQKLRRLKQSNGESLQNFAERILSLAEDAFVGQNQNNPLIQRELIETLKNGVKADSIARKLIREAPAQFDNAVQIAMTEQQRARSFEVRRGREEVPMEVDSVSVENRLNVVEQQMTKVVDLIDTLAKKLEVQTVNKPQFQFTADHKPICYYCKKVGHKQTDCRKKKADLERQKQTGTKENTQQGN